MSEPQFFQNQWDLWKVCFPESQTWTQCLEPLAELPQSKPVHFDKHCVVERLLFVKCARDWRTEINDPLPDQSEIEKESEHLGMHVMEPKNRVKIRVKGVNGRQLPYQCESMHLINQKCMFRASFRTDLCKPFMESIKLCTLWLHGNKYVDNDIKNTAPVPTRVIIVD